MKKTLLIIGLLLSCIGSIQAMDNGVETTQFCPWDFEMTCCSPSCAKYYQFTLPKKEGSSLPDQVAAAIAIGCKLHQNNAHVEHYRGIRGVMRVWAWGKPSDRVSLHDYLAQVGLKTISNEQIVELVRRRLQKAKPVSEACSKAVAEENSCDCGSSGEDESSDSEDRDSSSSSDSEPE